jgi:hypothetical protein
MLVLHVKGVKVVVKNEVRMGGAVGHFVHIFTCSCSIFIAAVDITLGL